MTQPNKRNHNRHKPRLIAGQRLIRRIVITEETDMQTLVTRRNWVITWVVQTQFENSTTVISEKEQNLNENTSTN